MDKNKLDVLSGTMMLGADEAGEIGRGAVGIVSYIKRIEDFIKATDTDEWVADSKGELLTSADGEEARGISDEEKKMISASKREKDGFVVIPRVV